MTRGERTDRRLDVMLVLTFVVTAGVLILAFIGLPVLFGARDATSEIQQNNELAACRSEVAGEVWAAITSVILTTTEAMDAIVAEDRVAQSDEMAQLDVDREAAAKALARYAAAAAASRDDPEAFLESCRGG